MPLQPSTVSLAEFRSWFDEVERTVRAAIEDMQNDPIFTLLGEDTSDNKSDTLSTTGVDYSGYAKGKVPGGPVVKDAPVEEDRHNVTFITFVQRFNYELETISHDKYRMDDPDGDELVVRLWNGVGLFLTNALWNQNTGTSFDVLAHEGTIAYTNTTPDGVAIISSSHSGPNYSSATNIGGTGQLSGTNLTTNLQVGEQNVRTANNFSVSYDADAILFGRVSPMRETALQITKSVKVHSSANNAISIYTGGTMDLIEFKHAPKTTEGAYDSTNAALYKWATANQRNVRRMMKYKWNIRPMIIQPTKLDDDNLDYFRTAVCRIAFLPENPWCIVQNNSTTAPTSAW